MKILILTLFISFSLFGQNEIQTDSLISELEGASDEKRLEVYKTLCWDNRNSLPSKAEDYGLKALELAIYLGNRYEEASIYNYLGVVKRNQYDYPNALIYFYKALDLSERIDSKVETGYALNNIGDIHNRKDEDSLAYSYFRSACKSFNVLGDDKGLAYCYNQISMLFVRSEEYDSALFYNAKALEIKRDINDIDGVANSYRNIGIINLEKEEFELAQKYFLLALEIDTSIKNSFSTINDYQLLGKLYNRLKLYHKAVEYLNLSTYIGDDIESRLALKDTYKELSFAYKELKDFEKAYENYVIYKELNDRLSDEDKFKSQIQITMQVEFDKKQEQQEIIAQIVKRRQRIIWYALIGVILVISIVLIIIYKAYKAKQKSNNELVDKNKIINEQRTKLEEANSKLIESENAVKRSNDTKDKFFSIIAHDLRSPFSTLLGYSDLLNTSYDEFDDTQRKEFIKELYNTSNNTFNLLQNLLDWARSQSDKMVLRPIKRNINDLIKDNIVLLQNSADEKNIRINFDPSPNVVTNVDEHMINTVIRNLFSNAIKFTFPGGKINIRTRIKDEKILVSVEDNGMGIKAEDIEKLFIIDQHFKSSGTKNENGTGLGLILTKEFIDKNGGELFVESTEGKGSIFSFSLPLYELLA